MLPARLKVGDRVKVRATIGRVPAGTLGTVERVFSSIPGAYDVQFDDCPSPKMVQRRELEPVNETRLARE